MAKHGRKRNNNARYARAYAHITRVLCFLLSQVSHKLYNPLCNKRLHWFQKQHSTLSHFHAATPPQKHTKTPSSKQLFDLQSKTTRHFPQNDTLFSVKRYVVFYKMTRCFQQNDTMFLVKRHVVFGMMKYFQPIRCDTCDSKKNKTPSTRSRIRARVRTPFGQYPTIPSSNQTNPSSPPPFRIPSPQKKIHLRRNIHQQWNNHRQIMAQPPNQ